VAPNKLLLEAHEAIAWTQRALFLEPPHERVLIANPTLGCPAVGEVVSALLFGPSFIVINMTIRLNISVSLLSSSLKGIRRMLAFWTI
jgi:hypothetical protein